MKQVLTIGVAIGALLTAVPAYAANTALTMWNTGHIGDAVTESGLDGVTIGNQDLNGITVSFTFATRGTQPNDLTEGNINIQNTAATTQTLDIIAGANGFAGPSAHFALSGTILAALGVSDLTGDFFVDGANSLNGLSTGLSGVSIGSFDSNPLSGPHSFSFNGAGFDFVKRPYGMGEFLSLRLDPGAMIAVQGMSMTAGAVPEPSTWAMFVAGFGLMGLVGWRGRAKASSPTAA